MQNCSSLTTLNSKLIADAWWDAMNDDQRHSIYSQIHDLTDSNNVRSSYLGYLMTTSLKTRVKNDIVYICLECKKICNSASHAKNHNARSHQKKQKKRMKQSLRCSECKYQFTTVTSRKKHQMNKVCKKRSQKRIEMRQQMQCANGCGDWGLLKNSKVQCGHFVCQNCWEKTKQCRKCQNIYLE